MQDRQHRRRALTAKQLAMARKRAMSRRRSALRRRIGGATAALFLAAWAAVFGAGSHGAKASATGRSAGHAPRGPNHSAGGTTSQTVHQSKLSGDVGQTHQSGYTGYASSAPPTSYAYSGSSAPAPSTSSPAPATSSPAPVTSSQS